MHACHHEDCANPARYQIHAGTKSRPLRSVCGEHAAPAGVRRRRLLDCPWFHEQGACTCGGCHRGGMAVVS